MAAALYGLALVVACWVTGFVAVNVRSSDTLPGSVVRGVFPQVGSGIDQATVAAAWDTVRQQYWRTDVTAANGTQAAVAGIVTDLHDRYGDRFSAFFTRAQYQELQDSLGGRRSGSVGIELEARCSGGTVCASGASPSEVVVTGVLRNQPAEKAGVRRGDVLIAVAGRPLSAYGSGPDAQIAAGGDQIRGTAGTAVALGVSRGTQTLTLTVTRADLQLPAVYSQRFGGTEYIQVTAFDEGVGDAVHSALQTSFAAGATTVILDLRQNPGGLVSEAQSLASQFLTRSGSEQDVVVRRGRITGGDPQTAQSVVHDAIQNGGVAPNQRLAVLVDSGSASAAEIVTAALRDFHRATVIGEKTFGKGSVQQDFPLPDGSDLHLTVEKWFGPAGETIDGTGISPDRAVPLPSEDSRFRLDSESVDSSQDPQLQAALAAVAGG